MRKETMVEGETGRRGQEIGLVVVVRYFLLRVQPFLKRSCDHSTYLFQPRFGVSLAPMTGSVRSPPPLHVKIRGNGIRTRKSEAIRNSILKALILSPSRPGLLLIRERNRDSPLAVVLSDLQEYTSRSRISNSVATSRPPWWCGPAGRRFQGWFSVVSRDIPSHRPTGGLHYTVEKRHSTNSVPARVLTTLKGLAACDTDVRGRHIPFGAVSHGEN